MSGGKIIVVGRLAIDPELRQTRDGKSLCRGVVAKRRRFGEESDFLDFCAWGKDAEYIVQRIGKGDLLWIVGDPQINRWDGRDGVSHRDFLIAVEEVSLLKKKEAKEGEKEDEKADAERREPAFENLKPDDDLPF